MMLHPSTFICVTALKFMEEKTTCRICKNSKKYIFKDLSRKLQ